MSYAFLDGDNIGKSLEILLTENKISDAQSLSLSIIDAMREIKNFLSDNAHVEVIILGGDDVLINFKQQVDILNILEGIRRIFKDYTGLTMSCGVGSTLKEAIWNLHLAKLFGKDAIEGIHE